MTSRRLRLLRLLRVLGLEPTDVADRAVLVSRRNDEFRVDTVDDRTWIVQPKAGRSRSVEQMGRPRVRTHLLVDKRAARTRMRLHQRGLYDYLASEHVAWMLRELDINCVLDVGANVGQYGRKLRKAGYRGRIVSFEPLPHLANKLRKVAADDPDWQVVECALGDTEHESEMNVAAGPGTTSSLLPASDFGRTWSARLGGAGTAKVQVRRLDSMFSEIVTGLVSPRVYLKLDTQGYDVQAFSGAGDCITRILGMQSEVSSVPIYDGMPRLPDQIALYEDAGFESTGIFPVSRDPRTHRVIEYDVVMIRVDGLPHPDLPASP
ncbi:MAG TPA: FkbM family methyltransferase [Nocardioidaceae bacterium]|nr:FkbM family methyltransferase [Nocardioidaceae bacterium]